MSRSDKQVSTSTGAKPTQPTCKPAEYIKLIIGARYVSSINQVKNRRKKQTLRQQEELFIPGHS